GFFSSLGTKSRAKSHPFLRTYSSY
ncbi:hypothetical protein D030_4190B, partial [Vibrio parahaemolyticus AQ3810]